MFDGFKLEFIEVSGATLRVRYGGRGKPVLLLHGHPRTHVTWHKVAAALAPDYFVVCPDLRGFGQSSIPADTPDHSGSSKRAKAQDCLELMRKLGCERFFVVGHDRGSYTAFRLAMDFPETVERLVILDGIPIIEALERCNAAFAKAWWHWFFFAQPEKPERVINADPEAWYRTSSRHMGDDAFADFLAAVHDPNVVHGMLEDYRAGIAIDHVHDAEDRRRGRQIQCPLLVMWSLNDDLQDLYGDVLGIWRPWAGASLSGKGLVCGHHMAEEIPMTLAGELKAFFG